MDYKHNQCGKCRICIPLVTMKQIIQRPGWKSQPRWSHQYIFSCPARSGFFLEALHTTKKNGWGLEINTELDELMFSVRKIITFYWVISRFKTQNNFPSYKHPFRVSFKIHPLYFYINNLLKHLVGKQTAWEEMSVKITDIESCKRLKWRLYLQCVSAIHVYSVFKFY